MHERKDNIEPLQPFSCRHCSRLIRYILCFVGLLYVFVTIRDVFFYDEYSWDLTQGNISPLFNLDTRFQQFLNFTNTKKRRWEILEFIRNNEGPNLNVTINANSFDRGIVPLSTVQNLNPSAQRTEDVIQLTRDMIIDWVGGDVMYHEIIFASSRDSAFKLIGEWFPFNEESVFACVDCHAEESVRQIAEYAKAAHASVVNIPFTALLQPTPFTSNVSPLIPSPSSTSSLSRTISPSFESAQSAPSAHLSSDTNPQPQSQSPPVSSPDTPDSSAPDVTYHLVSLPTASHSTGDLIPPSTLLGIEGLVGKFRNKSHATSPSPSSQGSSSPPTHTKTQKTLILVDATPTFPTMPMLLQDKKRKFALDPRLPSLSGASFVLLPVSRLFGVFGDLYAIVTSEPALSLLISHKHYFGGGAITVSLADDPFFQWKPLGCSRFEDGSIPFLDIISLHEGMSTVKELEDFVITERESKEEGVALSGKKRQRYRKSESFDIDWVTFVNRLVQKKGQDVQGRAVHQIVQSMWNDSLLLVSWLRHEMTSLKHTSGSPIFRIHSHRSSSSSPSSPQICFDVVGLDGKVIDPCIVITDALLSANISLGLTYQPLYQSPFSNQTACEIAYAPLSTRCAHLYQMKDKALRSHSSPAEKYSVRISFGFLNTFRDTELILHYFRSRYVDRSESHFTNTSLLPSKAGR